MKGTWKYQTADGLAVHNGNPTDSTGLRLRRSCGYGWVKIPSVGWLQLSVAIRKLEIAERIAAAQIGASS